MRSLSVRNGAFSAFSLMNLVSMCFFAKMAKCLSRILHLRTERQVQMSDINRLISWRLSKKKTDAKQGTMLIVKGQIPTLHT